jgi:DNA-binding CsgD family transcriptional regulator
MADERPTVLIALANRRSAEELAAWLGENEGMLPVLADEAGGQADNQFDAAVSDDPGRATTAPTVLLADAAPALSANGALRAVLRPGSAESLVAAAIRLAVAGYEVAPGGTASPAPRPRRDHPEILPAVTLTHREQEVIALLAEGASNKVIARRLDISVHTAKFHVAAILEKLGAVNRTDAIAIAMREGLVLV